MDLSTVEKKLKAGYYTSPSNFALDVRKIWNNAWAYNKPGSDIYIATTKISDYFENLMKEVEDVPFGSNENDEIQELKKKMNRVSGALKKITGTVSAGNTPRSAATNGQKKFLERPMTPHEKALLGQNIRKLPQEKILEMLQILKDVIDLSKAKDGLELDLEKLPAKKCRELDTYVKKALSSVNKPSKKKCSTKKKKVEERGEVCGEDLIFIGNAGYGTSKFRSKSHGRHQIG